MSVQLQDYPDMVERLGKGGFSAEQTAALVQLVGRLFSDQKEHIDTRFEQLRHENRSEHEKTRTGLGELESKFENRFEILDGKIERQWRWMIAMLTTVSLSLISALTILLTRLIE